MLWQGTTMSAALISVTSGLNSNDFTAHVCLASPTLVASFFF